MIRILISKYAISYKSRHTLNTINAIRTADLQLRASSITPSLDDGESTHDSH